MTNFKDTLKSWEATRWEKGSAWQKANIAYRHNQMHELTKEELTELVETVDEMNFMAQMSDDYRVTREEIMKNNAIVAEAKKLL